MGLGKGEVMTLRAHTKPSDDYLFRLDETVSRGMTDDQFQEHVKTSKKDYNNLLELRRKELASIRGTIRETLYPPTKNSNSRVTEDMIERALLYPIGNLIEVKNNKALCLFHNDSKPSMWIKNNYDQISNRVQ